MTRNVNHGKSLSLSVERRCYCRNLKGVRRNRVFHCSGIGALRHAHLETLEPAVAAAELLEEEEAVLGADHLHVAVKHGHEPLLAAARPPEEEPHQVRRLGGLVRPFRRRGTRARLFPLAAAAAMCAARRGSAAPWWRGGHGLDVVG